MKITKSKLKEIIKKTLHEDWWTDMTTDAQVQYVNTHDSSKSPTEKNPSGKEEKDTEDKPDNEPEQSEEKPKKEKPKKEKPPKKYKSRSGERRVKKSKSDDPERDKLLKKMFGDVGKDIKKQGDFKSENIMKLTKNRLKEIIKEEIQNLNEAIGSYKSVFDYDPGDPHKAGRSFMDMFDGAEGGYSESWDTYGWNDNKNWQGAVDEYHKEIFKFVDEYVKTTKKARKMLDKTHKIFKKWRKTDGSKAGD